METHISKSIQTNLDESGDDYKLKTNGELIDIISEFGCGETEFHTSDIERLIRELSFFREREEILVERVQQLLNEKQQSKPEQNFCPKCGAKNWDREGNLKHCLDCENYW